MLYENTTITSVVKLDDEILIEVSGGTGGKKWRKKYGVQKVKQSVSFGSFEVGDGSTVSVTVTQTGSNTNGLPEPE
jgi:hypothetical protein